MPPPSWPVPEPQGVRSSPWRTTTRKVGCCLSSRVGKPDQWLYLKLLRSYLTDSKQLADYLFIYLFVWSIFISSHGMFSLMFWCSPFPSGQVVLVRPCCRQWARSLALLWPDLQWVASPAVGNLRSCWISSASAPSTSPRPCARPLPTENTATDHPLVFPAESPLSPPPSPPSPLLLSLKLSATITGSPVNFCVRHCHLVALTWT